MKSLILTAAMLAGLSGSAALADQPAKPSPPDASVGSPAGLPDAVKTYVTSHPATDLPYSGKISIGHGVDGDVIWQQIPDYPAYRWTDLNGQRVVVEKHTNKVVAVY